MGKQLRDEQYSIHLSVRSVTCTMKPMVQVCYCFVLISIHHAVASTEIRSLTSQNETRTHIRPIKSCLDVLKNGVTKSGFYPTITEDGKSQTLFCDLCSEHGSAWTLVMSFSKKNLVMKEFLTAPLLADVALNDAIPNWNAYRLSRDDMLKINAQSTHWRFTCSYPDHKVDYRDYARARLSVMNPLIDKGNGSCTQMEYLDVRGQSCADCTAAWWQDSIRPEAFHLDSSVNTCEFDGGKGTLESEDNFGYYITVNPKFRCLANDSSTTNFWMGSYLK